MLVKDFMIKDVISVGPKTSIKEVMKIFVEKKIGGLPICDETGKLLGIVTDGDILRAIKPIDGRIHDYFSFIIYREEQNLEQRLKEMAGKEILNIARTTGLVTVDELDDMKKVVQVLSKHHFKKLPVVNKQRQVVGVISRGDVIRKIQTTLLKEFL